MDRLRQGRALEIVLAALAPLEMVETSSREAAPFAAAIAIVVNPWNQIRIAGARNDSIELRIIHARACLQAARPNGSPKYRRNSRGRCANCNLGKQASCS